MRSLKPPPSVSMTVRGYLSSRSETSRPLHCRLRGVLTSMTGWHESLWRPPDPRLLGRRPEPRGFPWACLATLFAPVQLALPTTAVQPRNAADMASGRVARQAPAEARPCAPLRTGTPSWCTAWTVSLAACTTGCSVPAPHPQACEGEVRHSCFRRKWRPVPDDVSVVETKLETKSCCRRLTGARPTAEWSSSRALILTVRSVAATGGAVTQ